MAFVLFCCGSVDIIYAPILSLLENYVEKRAFKHEANLQKLIKNKILDQKPNVA